MLQIECPKCESRSGLNIMKGEVTQLMDAATKTPQITEWTCGYCGYKDSDTVYMGEMGGSQNTKSMVGEFPVEAPILAARPKAPLSTPRPVKVSKPEPVVTKTEEVPVDDTKE